MKNPIKIYLFISGLILCVVGSYIAFTPVNYVASLTVQTDLQYQQATMPSLNMLSDLRGMGGMLLGISLYIVLSAFRVTWQSSALRLSALVYGSFFIFRSLGFILDGLPGSGLLIAYAIEFTLAVTGFALNNSRYLVVT